MKKTKCIVLGESNESTKKVPIKFEEYLSSTSNTFEVTDYGPADYNVIELICYNYGLSKMDLMYAYGHTRSCGVLYLGYWNDGVV